MFRLCLALCVSWILIVGERERVDGKTNGGGTQARSQEAGQGKRELKMEGLLACAIRRVGGGGQFAAVPAVPACACGPL